MVLANWSNTLKADLDKLTSIVPQTSISVPRLREGERRIVSVLFADIKGFTAMSEKLDPEDVQLIIDRCFKILTGEVERFGGYIDKYEGDRMMALFGSHKASEHDCQNALRAALGMKSKFREINDILKERGIAIGMRIGVNTGLVVTGKIGKEREQDFTVMGDTVNLASRLEENAPANEIMIEDETKKIAGDVFLYESLGEIRVKGKKEPCRVYRVMGLNPVRIKRWKKLQSLSKAPYVGRDKEIQHILDKYNEIIASKNGSNTVLGIKAGAGLGKTRLVDEFINSLAGEIGSLPPVLDGHCFSSANAPYSLFSTALGNFFKSDSRNELSAHEVKSKIDKLCKTLDEEEVKRIKSSLSVLGYVLGIELGGNGNISALEPEALALEVKLAVKNFLQAAANDNWNRKKIPLILNLEDIQWADTSSISVLKYCLENLDTDARLFVILQYRPEFGNNDLFEKQKKFEVIELFPLNKKCVLEMISGILGEYNFPSKFEERIVAKSTGNPFYVEELIFSLVESGVLKKLGECYVLEPGSESLSLPDSVSRILLSRIDALDEISKKVLLISSVIGEEIDNIILERVAKKTGIENEALFRSIDILEKSNFIESLSEVVCSFKNPVVRDVVYGTLLNYNKKLLHRFCGDAILDFIKATNDDILENSYLLANHYINAERIRDAYKYSVLALRKSLREYNNEEALTMSDQLLPLIESADPHFEEVTRDEAIFEILEIRAKVLEILGMRFEQKTTIDKLMVISEYLGDNFKRARVKAIRAKYNIDLAEYKLALSDGEDILEMLEGRNKGALYCEALKVVGLVYFNMGEYEKALNHFQARLEIGGFISDSNPFTGSSSSVMANSYNAIGLIFYKMGRCRESAEHYKKSLSINEKTGDKIGRGISLGNLGLVHWTMGEFEIAINYYNDVLKLFSETGYKKGIATITGNMGAIYSKLGKYEKALELFDQATKIRENINDKKGVCFDIFNTGLVYKALGDFRQSLMYFYRALGMAREQENKYVIASALNEIAEVLQESETKNDLEQALEAAKEACRIGRDLGMPTIELFSFVRLSKAYLKLGDLEEALDTSKKAIHFIDTHEETEKFTQEIFFNHYTVLKSLKRVDEAIDYLEKAYRIIRHHENRIQNIEFRKSFIENVRLNRDIINEKEKLNV